MKENEPIMLTDILHFDREKGKRVKLKDCSLLNSFLFSKNEFHLAYKGGYFFVCISVNGELVALWYQKEIDKGEKYFANSVISNFRIKYMKNNITQNDIDRFLEDPIKYEKTRLK
jgi:hypothetical protein